MFVGMPRPPTNLSELSTEDLRKIEGQERENVEARIQWLRDIQALMDGAMVMINQYNTVAAQLRYTKQGYLQFILIYKSAMKRANHFIL
jgi:hypothetical protein